MYIVVLKSNKNNNLTSIQGLFRDRDKAVKLYKELYAKQSKDYWVDIYEVESDMEE